MAKPPKSEEDGAVLFVRQFPKGLLGKLKAAAALDGKTLSQYVVEMCEAHVEDLEKKGLLPKGK